ncbi:MAG: hypothetical protein AB1746_12865 [Candidatus Zixiibacteriota bacterium]
MCQRYKVILIVIFAVLLCSSQLYGQSKVGTAYEPDIYSPRVIALGSCGINMVSEQSVIYNPGTLGIFHLNKTFAFSCPNKFLYLPTDYTDLYRNSMIISGGIYWKTFQPFSNSNHNFGIAFAYTRGIYESRLKLEEILSDPDIELPHDWYIDDAPVRPVDYISKTIYDYYTLALGYENGIRLGAGMTFKKVSYGSYYVDREEENEELSDLERHSIGAIFEIDHFLGDIKAKGWPGNHIGMTNSLAFTNTSLGEDDAGDERYAWRIGLSSRIYVSSDHINTISLQIIFQELKEDDFVRYFYDYDSYYEDIVSFQWQKSLGIETMLFELVAFRVGKNEGTDRVSYGFGLSSRGLAKILDYKYGISKKHNSLSYILTHVSLNWDFARSTGLYGNRISFYKLSLSF